MVSSYKTQAAVLEERCNDLQRAITSSEALQKVIAGMFAKRYMIEIESFYGQYPTLRVLLSIKSHTNIASSAFLNNGIKNLDTLNQLLDMDDDSFFAKIKRFFGGKSFDSMVSDAINLKKRIEAAYYEFIKGTVAVWPESNFPQDSEITKLVNALAQFADLTKVLAKIKADDDSDPLVAKIEAAFQKLADYADEKATAVEDMIDQAIDYRKTIKKFTKKLNGHQKTISSRAQSLTASVKQLLLLPAPVGLGRHSSTTAREKNRAYRKIMSKLKNVSSDMDKVNKALKDIKAIAKAIRHVKDHLNAETTIVDIRNVPDSLAEINSLLQKLEIAIQEFPD